MKKYGISEKTIFFVFDLDNTLVKTNQANNLAYKEAIKSVVGNDIKISNERFTRNDLTTIIPSISSEKIVEIIERKERLYGDYLQTTILNLELFKILKILRKIGQKTILLTDSHSIRALQVCSYHSITSYFNYLYCKEDYGGNNKYEFLKKQFSPNSVFFLFENDPVEISKAKQHMCENQILTIKF